MEKVKGSKNPKIVAASHLAWPATKDENCKRNCQDCGNLKDLDLMDAKKSGISTETKCANRYDDMKVSNI